MRHRRLLNTALVVATFLCTLVLPVTTTFAKWGDPNVNSGLCNGGSICWSSYTSHNGGLVWIYYEGSNSLTFRNVPGNKYPSSASGDTYASTVSCNTPGIYFLASLWHYSGGGLTGDFYGPTRQSAVTSWESQVRTDVPLSLGAGYTGNLSTAAVKAAYDVSGNPASAWNNLSWFCKDAGRPCEQFPVGSREYTCCMDPSNAICSESCPIPYNNDPGAGTFERGTAYSSSGIRSTITPDYSPTTYAKPNDKFNWAHCYYREEQEVQFTMYQPEDEALHASVKAATGTGTFYQHPDKYTNDPVPGLTYYVVTDVPGYVNENKGKISTDYRAEKIFGEAVTFSLNHLRGANRLSIDASGNITGEQKKNDATVVFSGSGGKSDLTYTVQVAHAGEQDIQRVESHIGTNSVVKHKNWDNWTGYFTYCATSCGHSCTCGTAPNTYSCCCHNVGTSCCDDYRVNEANTVWGVHADWVYLHEPGTKTSATTDSSRASIYVPFNFDTTVTSDITQDITADNQSQNMIVMANEKVKITAEAAIVEKYNSVTLGNYATETPPNGKIEWVSFYLPPEAAIPAGSGGAAVGSVCDYFSEGIDCTTLNTAHRGPEVLNPSGNLSGQTYSFSQTPTIKNVPAGYRYCTSIGITPTNNGEDDNTVKGQDSGYFSGTPTVNTTWHISGATCRTVASSPNIQVWGGHIATNGTIKTGTNKKVAVKVSGSATHYGSWGEYAIINTGSHGKLYGIASGAGIGYTAKYETFVTKTSGAVGGQTSTNCTLRAKLSIPNVSCGTTSKLEITTSSGITITNTLVDRIVQRYSNPSYCNTSANCRYYNTSTVGGQYLGASQTAVFRSTGDINITGNLEIYKGPFAAAAQVPNFVIIADGNVNISPNVSEVNGWIITKGTVNTCTGKVIGDDTLGGGTISTDVCGQLKINGIIVAKDMNAFRAGGGGAQESSGDSTGGIGITYHDTFNTEPAELVNYSVGSYLWAYSQAKKDTQAHTVYTRTLAPRL